MKNEKEEALEFCIWGKIRKLLKEYEIKTREKTKYKDKIGWKLIRDNKLFSKEFFFWCDIFNDYKQKLPLFYGYAKSYKNIFSEIISLLGEIKNKLQMDDETFIKKICKVVYKFTSKSDYKDILEIINTEMFNKEYLFGDVKFASNLENVEINERNIFNSEYIVNLLSSENAYFEKEIDEIKRILDKMTDLCECSAILDSNILTGLKEYLKGHQNFLAKNIND